MIYGCLTLVSLLHRAILCNCLLAAPWVVAVSGLVQRCGGSKIEQRS